MPLIKRISNDEITRLNNSVYNFIYIYIYKFICNISN